MSDIYTLFEGVTVHDVDLEGWRRAWKAWLGGGSVNTRRAYEQAWRDLADHYGWGFGAWEPWVVRSADLEDWVDDMRGRGLAGNTMRQRLGAVSSFFGFVSKRYLVDGQVPLFHFNPAQGVDLPKVGKYDGAVYLSGEQVRALMRAIPRDSARGLRNYALLLFYVATGRRSGEVRRLRWVDFKHGERVLYHWRGKGRSR